MEKYIFCCGKCVLYLFIYMAKRKKEREHNFLTYSIVVGILGIFLAFSIFKLAGVLGEAFLSGVYFVIGWGTYPLALFLFYLTYKFAKIHFADDFFDLTLKQKLGFILLSLSLLSLLSGAEVKWGGIVGATISESFSIFLSPFFSSILLIIIFLISVIMVGLVDLERLTEWVKGREEDYDEYDDDEEGEEDYDEEEEEYDDEEDEEEEYDEDEEEYDDDEDEEDEIIEKKPRKNSKEYKIPPLSLLNKDSGAAKSGNTKATANNIRRTFKTFNIDVEIEEISVGPTVTRYAFKPAEGVRLQKIVGLKTNLELALAAHPIRIEAPIPGRALVGIEVPNKANSTVGLASMFASKEFKASKTPLTVAIGKNTTGVIKVASIQKMPHMLVAGATGSGKSVFVHNLILSLLFQYGPNDLSLVLIDPKRVEMTLYNGVPHLLSPVITEPKKVLTALTWIVEEMERRYEILEKTRLRDIIAYRNKFKELKEQDEELEHMQYIVVVIDELADIMQIFPRELESLIVRIAQKSRAVGIHLILSTQRPSVNVITGTIKANVPTRIALKVSSQIDSRTIIDSQGAESLVGNGDLLFLTGSMQKPERVQAAFVLEDEIKDVVDYIKENSIEPLYEINLEQGGKSSETGGGGDDELYEEAKAIVIENQKASTSLLQRRLKVGYSRAARLVDMLEDNGIVGPPDGSRPREVLIEKDE